MTLLLKLENLAIALLALAFYAQSGAGWQLFLLLVLVPDVTILAYVFGPRAGAVGYNVLHSFIGAAVLLIAGHFLDWSFAVPVALIWIFHIGIDRALGFGLKYPTGFKHTHLENLN